MDERTQKLSSAPWTNLTALVDTYLMAQQGLVHLNQEQAAMHRRHLDVMIDNCKLLYEMLCNANGEQSSPSNWDTIQEVNQACRHMQFEVVRLIGRGANDEITGVLLKVNDDMNSVFMLYDSLASCQQRQLEHVPTQGQIPQRQGAQPPALRHTLPLPTPGWSVQTSACGVQRLGQGHVEQAAACTRGVQTPGPGHAAQTAASTQAVQAQAVHGWAVQGHAWAQTIQTQAHAVQTQAQGQDPVSSLWDTDVEMVDEAQVRLYNDCHVENIPKHWQLASDKTCECYRRIKIEPDGVTKDEFEEIGLLFYKTESKYQIVNIYRIENLELWDNYCRKRSQMQRKLPHGKTVFEERLFHGTNERCIDAICEHQGFDFRLGGSRHGAVLGRGCYFARDAELSCKYAEGMQLIVARVLVGEYTLGKSAFVRPPPKDVSKPNESLYDSCVERLTFPKVYVIFDQNQAYPEYIIQWAHR